MVEVGRQLRALRQRQGLTLQQLASMTDLSRSFISQIEVGAANPSVGSLKKVADALGVPIGSLFEVDLSEQSPNGARSYQNRSPQTDVRIVRKDCRKTLSWPGRQWQTYLLTPDLQRNLEVLLNELAPGDTVDEAYTHEGEEFGFVLEGRYEVTVGDEIFVLEEGDSISYPSHLPHKMRVVGDTLCRTIWVITPPSF